MLHDPNLTATPPLGACLFIGQDRLGHWIVRDALSQCGGLFVSRTEAIRFAMYERQRRPQSVIMLPNGLELDGEAPAFPSLAPPRNNA